MSPSQFPSQTPVPNASESPAPVFFRRHLPEIGLLGLCLFLFFWRLGSVPLFDYDEGLYVTCAKQMIVSGDFVTPRVNTRFADRPAVESIPFFEKPILVYWASAGSMRLFGIVEWAARFPAALAALLVTFATYWAGRRWFGRRAGLLAGVVYATAPITIADARQMTTDGLLVLWFTVALLAFWGIYRAGQKRSDNDSSAEKNAGSLYPVLFWLMCTLAVLTKGAVGLLLPLLVIGVFFGSDRAVRRFESFAKWRLPCRPDLWKTIRGLRPILGLIVLFALAAPWHILIARTAERDGNNRTFIQEYVIRQHIGRFKGLDTVHNLPFFTYFGFFLIGFFPWACFTPAAFRLRAANKQASIQPSSPSEATPSAAISVASEREYEAHRFLLVWFWTIFIFFSVGAAKLPTYIVPAYPAAAILLGRWLDSLLTLKRTALKDASTAPDSGTRSLQRGAFAAFVTGTLLVTAAVIGPRFAPASAPISPAVVRIALHLTGLLALGSGAAWVCFLYSSSKYKGSKYKRSSAKIEENSDDTSAVKWRRIGVSTLAAMMALVIGIGCTEGYAVARAEVQEPYQSLAAAARPDADRGIPVVYYNILPRRPSMNFYAGYAPLETHETPLLPFLARYLTDKQRQADVICSRDAFEHILRPEFSAANGVRFTVTGDTAASKNAGNKIGWVLLRVTLP